MRVVPGVDLAGSSRDEQLELLLPSHFGVNLLAFGRPVTSSLSTNCFEKHLIRLPAV
jgi:hypothetical protein